jgi:hypothetical protein
MFLNQRRLNGHVRKVTEIIKGKDTEGMENETDNQPAIIKGSSRIRRFGLVTAGIGLGSVVAYLLTKALRGRTQKTEPFLRDHVVDDRGTGQEKAVKILRNLRDRAFESSDEKLALALGRPVQEVAGWNAGAELIDDDVVMKARGIAMNRGIHVE